MRFSERVETSLPGRIGLTLLMALLVASVLLWNLPAGRPRDVTHNAAGRVVLPVGLDQDWALFAPDPRGFSVGVYARVTHADGRTSTWRPPDGGLVVAPYRSYRWQKYVERLRADDYRVLWDPAARWIARQSGQDVRSVVLVRTFRDVVTPGTRGPKPPWQEYAFYTLTLQPGERP